jgi:hypothetical protein
MIPTIPQSTTSPLIHQKLQCDSEPTTPRLFPEYPSVSTPFALKNHTEVDCVTKELCGCFEYFDYSDDQLRRADPLVIQDILDKFYPLMNEFIALSPDINPYPLYAYQYNEFEVRVRNLGLLAGPKKEWTKI